MSDTNFSKKIPRVYNAYIYIKNEIEMQIDATVVLESWEYNEIVIKLLFDKSLDFTTYHRLQNDTLKDNTQFQRIISDIIGFAKTEFLETFFYRKDSE